jgi:filamentous hemagglutinin family protein
MTRQLRPPSELSTLQAVMQTSQRISVALGFLAVSAAQPSLAQSISIDGTTPTTLNGGNSCSGDCAIAGGLRDGSGSGPNLFHSFDTFNVDAGSTVTFTNPSGIDNIFSRVTGISNLSHLDGTLKVDGPANLFLLNANGIVFGPDAQLDIQGSFLSSTASSLLFQGGSQFGAIPSQMPSLLTVNVPVGLQFGTAASPIQIQGNGHSLSYNPDATITRGALSGLVAPNGKTLAFIGSGVTLAGGNVTAESGHIEVGSVGTNSVVNIAPTAMGWDFDYAAANRFEDIQLTDQSALDVSGDDAGSIHLQGRQISLSEGSAMLAQVLTAGGGQIALDASESISLTGVDLSATAQMPTAAYIEIASGATGDGSSQLRVSTPTLNLTAGAQIGLGMAGEGTSGRFDVTAQTITADNGSNAGPSSLYTAVLPTFATGRPPATGQGGDLFILTEQLRLTNGAQFVASTFGIGDAGRLSIEAKSIEAIGFNDGGPTNIASTSEVPFSGAGGSVTIRSGRLLVADGAQVTVSTVSSNPAGDLTIEATDSVELRGSGEKGLSGLFASSLFGSGAGGNIQVNTQNLALLEGATINASNFPSSLFGPPPGSGPAGNVTITAGNVLLKDGSLITADTVAGDRANINIFSDSLVLRRGSNITTNATGTATGGNINIDTQALIAFENSDITANAVDNFGGRVVVNAETILGTAFREQLTSESDITASSALGPAFSGSVELNTPDVDPTNGLTELPTGLAAADKIVAACEQTQSNAFVATGRGGLPEDASQLITNQSIWNDFRLIESADSLASGGNETAVLAINTTAETASVTTAPIAEVVEAQAWSIDSEGRVVLGLASTPPAFTSSNCLS